MVRLLTPDDIPALVALRQQALLDAPWAFASSPGDDRGSDPAQVAQRMAKPGAAYAGGFHDQRLASIAVLLREDGVKRRHVCWLVSVFTAPGARGHGLARRTCALAIDQARAWGCAVVLLGVSEHAPGARRMYEHLGFVPFGHEPDALRVDGRSIAETHMRLAL